MKSSLRLDHLNIPLTIEEKHQQPDEAGGFMETWRHLGTVWGHVLPVLPSTAFESWHMGEHTMNGRYRIWIRGYLHLGSNVRFHWEDDILETIAAPVFVDGRRFQMFIVERREPPHD